MVKRVCHGTLTVYDCRDVYCRQHEQHLFFREEDLMERNDYLKEQSLFQF